MEGVVEYLRLAEQCLAIAYGTSHERTRAELRQMAEEYRQKAVELAAKGAAQPCPRPRPPVDQ
jgi:DNA-binding transcriptional regulator YdaS (Cro superfamily)